MGTYTHVSNSLHIYEKHYEMVEAMTSDSAVKDAMQIHREAGPMPKMPSQPPIDGLFHIESHLRTTETFEDLQSWIDQCPDYLGTSDSYWVDWIRVLAAHRCGKLKMKSEKKALLKSTEFSGYHQF